MFVLETLSCYFLSDFPRWLSSVQSLSRVRVFATPWTTARQASLCITSSRSLLRLQSIASVMPSPHLVLCRPRLLPPSVLPGRYSLPKAGRVSPCPSVSPPRLHTSTFFPLPCPPSYSGTNAVSRRLRVELRKWTGGGEGSVLHSGEEAALCIQIRCRDYLPGSGASLPWSDFPFPWRWGRAVWVPSPLGTERPKHETGAAL